MSTPETMLDRIDALDGSVDWTDASVYERILSGSHESDGEVVDHNDGDQGDSDTGTTPAASSEAPAAAVKVEQAQESAAGVATRDGKHVIPFAVLEAARTRAEQLARDNEALRQQLEDIQMVMDELDAAEQRCIQSLSGLKTDGD